MGKIGARCKNLPATAAPGRHVWGCGGVVRSMSLAPLVATLVTAIGMISFTLTLTASLPVL
ncbi:MAG: hypothetical protein AVDCRST_MAG77-154 [uncultured Chloroflexi bacterium]|uniref:Uncharacterized protein n=1 Tax=uncultured Chloroflexota bacterium TaxID=166587 RepID=A0A6J4H6X7_9CHLR|nr:MAG: hypothetical protein AVDCRST_MAG77-154 [uncultured Chloroflexota bacterium]